MGITDIMYPNIKAALITYIIAKNRTFLVRGEEHPAIV